jgi:Bacterial inner membrane protein
MRVPHGAGTCILCKEGNILADAIGWIATAVFASSYLCRQTSSLRRVQALAALLWLVYGVLMKAPPVIVANLIVATLALVSSVRKDAPTPIAPQVGTVAPQPNPSLTGL